MLAIKQLWGFCGVENKLQQHSFFLTVFPAGNLVREVAAKFFSEF